MFGAATEGAYSEGIKNWMALQQMSKMRAQDQGNDALIQAILNQGNPPPTAMNPPPGEASQPATPPQAGGQAADAAKADAPVDNRPSTGAFSQPSSQPSGGGAMSIVPPSIRAFIIGIKKQDPKASSDEIMAALNEALPWMTAQQQQDIATLKQKIEVFKLQQDQFNKDRTAGQRDRQLDISQKRADAYVKYLENRPNGKVVLAKAKEINAKTSQYQTQLTQLTQRNGGAPMKTSPDYQKYVWLQQQVVRGKQALFYLYSSNQIQPPPADIEPNLYQDDASADTGDDSGGDAAGSQ